MNLQSFYTFKTRFLFIVCLSVLSVILLIFLSPTSQRENVGNITNPISIIISAFLLVLILYNQKIDGEIGKAFLMLTIGLVVWAFKLKFYLLTRNNNIGTTKKYNVICFTLVIWLWTSNLL